MLKPALGLLILWILPFAISGLAQPSNNGEQESSISATQTEQINILNSQLELMQQYNDRILGTVYWSLAMLGAVTAVLVGFGWFANFQVYERDKRALQEDLNTRLGSELKRIETEIKETLSQQITEMSTSHAASLRKTIEAETGTLRQAIYGLQYSQLEMELEGWRKESVKGNELRTSVQMLRVAVAREYEWQIDRALDAMIYALKRGANPDSNLTREISDSITSLPDSHRITGETIRDMLRKAQRVNEDDNPH